MTQALVECLPDGRYLWAASTYALTLPIRLIGLTIE